MNNLHRENKYEEELVDHLKEHGWLEGEAAKYDQALALYPEDFIGWLKDTQPTEWAKIASLHNGDTEKLLLQRVAKLIEKDGTLALLRHGFKDRNARFQVCQFKPGHGYNPATQKLYEQVRCRVVRQVHYSLNNNNSIDVVLFINGIPVATLELKTDFTQRVGDAIHQYKNDRLPKDSYTRQEEPLLTFKRGALVHFAVSTDEIYMTTKLVGGKTVFLPFNLGHDQGEGNPPNPNGYRTSYLWEQILDRDHWLEIIGRFVHLERKTEEDEYGKKITKETVIFPRFHQWDAVTKLIAAAREEGAGKRYLIQHSAGSGKSNSIAWVAHQLASLHDSTDHKIFDSVIVVTDRTVLDKQLQDTIYQFEHKEGVVVRITDREVKSQQLVKALAEKAPIIIVTIQTFPFVLDTLQEQVSLQQRTFAVIADEAHSSQSGSSATWLKRVLTAQQIEEGEEISSEDVLTAAMEARTQPKTISFFAFTATPKAKTIELFGRPGADGIPQPFHVYSMQQAIEEGFILDVLKNYTPFKLAYRLAHHGRDYTEQEIEKGEGLKQLARWVRLHPHSIASKVEIMVEHYREQISPWLQGSAKAMVVTGSRKEAVRYKLAMDSYLKQMGYKLRTLVAFSGEVYDPDSGSGAFSEANMNPDLKGRDIREAFNTAEYQLLIVANKYQTGFDQPKLTAMYVDKKLASVAAVQTLSRLNRTYEGKTDAFVLDFVNTAEEMVAAFAPYYRTAQLSGVSDPNIVHDLQTKLDATHIYTESEVEAFAHAYFDPKGKQEQLQAFIAPAVDRYRARLSKASEEDDQRELDALEIFRKDLGSFVRAYEFLSQIFLYGDTDLEKHHVFYRHLVPWLKGNAPPQQLNLAGVELTHYRLRDLGKRQVKIREGQNDDEYTLKPLGEVGTALPHAPEMAALSALVDQMNELFAGDLTEADLVTYVRHITDKMLENDQLAQQAAANNRDQFALGDFSSVFMDTVIEGLDSYKSMAEQVLTNDKTKAGFEQLVLDMVYRGFEQMRKEQATTPS